MDISTKMTSEKMLMYRTGSVSIDQVCQMVLKYQTHGSRLLVPHRVLSMKDFKRELSLVAMKYVPPTSVQLTLLDQ